LGPVVRWPIDPVRYCDNCWLWNGGTCNVTRVSVDIQNVEAECCSLGACAAGRKLYRVLGQDVVTWELVLQGLSCTGCWVRML
jgi:hypothetical protein